MGQAEILKLIEKENCPLFTKDIIDLLKEGEEKKESTKRSLKKLRDNKEIGFVKIDAAKKGKKKEKPEYLAKQYPKIRAFLDSGKKFRRFQYMYFVKVST